MYTDARPPEPLFPFPAGIVHAREAAGGGLRFGITTSPKHGPPVFPR
ncbi:MAG: hypothetical protein M0037_10620 [Betaproteobacteria bacterium]|nr:hypothetical protein [Betaproteobacteria bacterium]